MIRQQTAYNDSTGTQMILTDNEIGTQDETVVKKVKASQKREQEFDELGEAKLPFHILGFNSQKQVLLWHKGKILPTPVRQLGKDDLKLLVGELPPPEKDQPCPYSKIKNRIINLAHKKGLVDDEEPIKSGIWKFKQEWVIVSGKRAAIIREGKLNFLETPIIHDRTIEFERSSWIDLDKLEKHLKNPSLSNTFSKVRNLISQWCWYDNAMIDYVTAFIMLQMFQSAMRWRPWLYLLGAAGTGKSSFFEHVIERLFGSQVKRLDKSTAHATAQSIGGTGKAAIFDEFEKNKHLSDVLELLKLCNRGGRKTSGTTTEKANEYALHHLPWLASIYLPKTFSSDQAQLSRVVKFELKKVPEGKFIIGLPDQEAQDLLGEIVASIIQIWPQIDSIVNKIEHNKEQYIKDCNGQIDGRCVENLMYSMALLSLVDNKERKIPAWAINEVKDDGENVLESIITSKIRYGQEEFIVIDLINLVLGESISIGLNPVTAKDLLRKNGLSVVQKKGAGWFLAIQCKDLSESLFKSHNDYKGLDIKAPLERLEGVEKNIKTDWGQQTKRRALHVPGHHINAISGGIDE